MSKRVPIDSELLATAREAAGQTTDRATVEEALRLLVKLRKQSEVDGAFGKYRWRGNLAASRKGRGVALRS